MFKQIITHSGIGHTDDFLSCCVLLTKYSTIENILRVNVVNEEDFNNNQSIILDIGGRYDGQRLFDHHQNAELNCSLILILKDIFGYNLDFLMNIPDIKYIDFQDRFGVKKAQEIMNINNPVINLIEYSILRWFSEKKIINDVNELNLLKEIGKQFLKFLDDFKNEEQKILKSKFYKTKYGLIVYNPNFSFNLTIITKLLPDLIGVIHQSDRDPSLINIVQINSNPHFIPTKLSNNITPVFIHKSGFLVVIKKEDITKINPFELIEERRE
jgi:hypothetical protein